MNFLKRAIKYCVRQRLRTLLLFLTFTLLSTTVLIAVSSEEAVLQGTKQIEETVGASVRMEIDMNNQNNFGPAEDFGNGASGYTYNGDRITEKMISAISKLPNVVSYNAKIDGGYWGIPENFEPIPGMVNAPGLSIPYTAVLDSSLDIKLSNHFSICPKTVCKFSFRTSISVSFSIIHHSSFSSGFTLFLIWQSYSLNLQFDIISLFSKYTPMLMVNIQHCAVLFLFL